MLSVNTNKYQLAAARSQMQVQLKVDTSFQRISSGKRINSAVDDSANPIAEVDFIEMHKTPATLSALGITSIALDPVEFAAVALGQIDLALADVSEKRSYYGAKLNQMQTAQRNIESTVELTSAARARIQDADFAKETAELLTNQVIQDSSTAVLAQANKIPEQILNLLTSATQ